MLKRFAFRTANYKLKITLYEKKVLILCICLLSILSVRAQNEVWHYQGIADNNYVWMATNYGLVRYDKTSGETKIFSSSQFKDISALTISEKGEIVVGGTERSGLAIFDGESFSPLNIDTERDLTYIKVLLDHDGLWVGNNGFLLRPTQSGWREYYDINPFLSAYMYQTLAWSEKDQRMWFGVGGTSLLCNLGYVDSNGIYFVREARTPIADIIVQDDGSLILGTSFGLQKYSDGKIENIDIPLSISYPGIIAVTRQDDAIWFGMRENMIRYDGKDFMVYKWDNLKAEDDIITDIISDKNGDLWVIFGVSGLVRFSDDEFTPILSGDPSVTTDPGNSRLN